jgi:hypothetical protein
MLFLQSADPFLKFVNKLRDLFIIFKSKMITAPRYGKRTAFMNIGRLINVPHSSSPRVPGR